MTDKKVKVFDLLMEKQRIYENANKTVSEVQFNVEQRAAEIQEEIDELINLIEEGE